MKRTFAALLVLLFLCTLAACGGGPPPPQPATVDILSDDTVDGDIALDPVNNSLTVTQVAANAVPSVFAGIDPGSLVEFRAFLDFPLAEVPLDAQIELATLDIVLTSINPPNGVIPIRIELVQFPPPALLPDYFYRQDLVPLSSITIVPPITNADLGQHVVVDVTPLMLMAQAQGFGNFQLRIMEDQDSGPFAPGLIEIDDTTSATAPLLSVQFF